MQNPISKASEFSNKKWLKPMNNARNNNNGDL